MKFTKTRVVTGAVVGFTSSLVVYDKIETKRWRNEKLAEAALIGNRTTDWNAAAPALILFLAHTDNPENTWAEYHINKIIAPLLDTAGIRRITVQGDEMRNVMVERWRRALTKTDTKINTDTGWFSSFTWGSLGTSGANIKNSDEDNVLYDEKQVFGGGRKERAKYKIVAVGNEAWQELVRINSDARALVHNETKGGSNPTEEGVLNPTETNTENALVATDFNTENMPKSEKDFSCEYPTSDGLGARVSIKAPHGWSQFFKRVAGWLNRRDEWRTTGGDMIEIIGKEINKD